MLVAPQHQMNKVCNNRLVGILNLATRNDKLLCIMLSKNKVFRHN